MIQEQLHQIILQRSQAICDWYQKTSSEVQVPIYSSYDIRDAGYKISTVDANIYPAGFNNICPVDKETSVDLMRNYIHRHYGQKTKKLVLVTEEHTQNPFYWDNVGTIQDLLHSAGFEVLLGFAQPLEAPLLVQSATGRQFQVSSAMANSKAMNDFQPDLIISNNDFSDSHDQWAADIRLPVNPPRELGWYQRRKSRFFQEYNQLVTEFCTVAGIDPFLIRVETKEFLHFSLEDPASKQELANHVDEMLAHLKEQYIKRGINQEPFVFVKNNSGTYGLAVIKVKSGAEVLQWSYKSRKKMKAAKGGRDVEEVIIQEGIPSIVKADGASAEPVIYMIGCELAGGFLRTHNEKSETESLNSPGAVYKRMCVSDLTVDPKGCPNENVYGWVAKLGLLALGREARAMRISYQSYEHSGCGPSTSL